MIIQNPKNSIDGWYFNSDEIRHTLSNGHMINPSIDLTNACNLNCPYCYIEEKNSVRKLRRPNELTLNETLHLIRDLCSCGAKTINIVGAGEPTIDPHFEEVVDYIYENDMTTVLFTNGIRFAHQPELVNFLYHRKVSVVLKFNSLSAETQDLVAGRRGYTQKRDIALESLIDAGFTAYTPTRLGVDMIVFKGNLSEIPKIHKWCRRENIFPIAGEFIPTGRTEDGVFQGFEALHGFSKGEVEQVSNLLRPIDSEERNELLRQIEMIDNELGIDRSDCIAYYGGGICTQLLGLYIDIEGNVWPCVARKKKVGAELTNGLLGNVRRGDMPSSIWRQDAYIHQLLHNYNGGCPYKPGLNPIFKLNHLNARSFI